MPNQPKVQVKKKQKPEESSHTIKKEPMNRNTSFKTEWIHKGFAPETIQHAEAVGKRADQLSSSVVRNFFDHIKQIQMKVETMDNTSFANAFLILKPRFVYTLKRQSGKKENPIINQFKDEILKAFQAVELKINETVFKDCFFRFCDYYEAILAYHKLYAKK